MKIEIGNNMYLFLSSRRINWHAKRLVISAHGGIRKRNSPTFQIPQIYDKIYFYSNHGDTTTDFGLSNFAQGNTAQMIEPPSKGGDMCYNYDLSKYQGKHSKGKETYDTIEIYQQGAVLVRRQQLERLIDNKPIHNKLSTEFDVLTIRNRNPNPFGIGGLNFETVLDKLLNTWRYEEIHCYFCRSFYPGS